MISLFLIARHWSVWKGLNRKSTTEILAINLTFISLTLLRSYFEIPFNKVPKVHCVVFSGLKFCLDYLAVEHQNMQTHGNSCPKLYYEGGFASKINLQTYLCFHVILLSCCFLCLFEETLRWKCLFFKLCYNS